VLLGADCLMNEAPAGTKLIGNGITTIAIAKFFDRSKAKIAFRVQDMALSLHRRGTP
jgi:hypothetical protein